MTLTSRISSSAFLSTPPSRVATFMRHQWPGWSDKRFYPRHPRGWRHHFRLHNQSQNQFLSTPPSRVATAAYCCTTSADCLFLSTPPSRVATFIGIELDEGYFRFYPRHPRGWRRLGAARLPDLGEVSIHATLAGGDYWVHRIMVFWGVSIHATLAGGDCLRPI